MNEVNAAENKARIIKEHRDKLKKAAEDKERSDLEARTLAATRAAEAARKEAFAKEKAA